MSVINAIFNKSAYSYEDAFKAADNTSPHMRAAIQKWFDLYFRKDPTEEEDPCQQIPYTVVRKLTKTAFSEYKAASDNNFTASVLKSLDEKRKTAMEMALIGGECYLKPVPPVKQSGKWSWTVVNRANILVFGRDADGRMTDVGTAERSSGERCYYTLLERRTVDANGYLTIRNKLYRSENADALGIPVSLRSVEKYTDLPEEYTYQKPVGSIGLVTVKTPVANCVDGSCDGVSVYAAAVGLIRNIDRNEAQINGEFDRGKSKVFASSDLLKKGEDGRRRLADDIFVGLDDDPEAVGVTIFSPELREQSFLARKKEYLRNVESVIGLKRGLLSEVEAQERTAKEVTSSEGDYNLTIIDFQEMWENAVREAVKLCGTLGTLYHIDGAHEVTDDEVTIDWGNGVLYDEDKTWADYLDMVARGLLKPEIALGWRFGMPTDTPKDLQAIREKYMPELQQMVDGEE